ncbi:MAG: transglutaminase-like domain-containing protein [Clostridiales Family XIII bacterium]|jgi:hypothetical protein|nr:transglutaminase-like domain-containing protein [Clostridiales Family XIII bacterium]
MADVKTSKRRAGNRSIARRVISGLFLTLLVALIVFAGYLIHQKIADDRAANVNILSILDAQLPLSANPTAANGILEPRLDAILTDKASSLDLSGTNEGYLFFRYDGAFDCVAISLCSIDDEGVVHADNPSVGMAVQTSQTGVFPTYNYPVNSGWQGYALPYGSGTYTATIYPYNEDAGASEPEETSVFTFAADFERDAPYKYRNAYSYYDENSSAVLMAAYLTDHAETLEGRPLTDKEKTDVIVRFVRNNISPNETIQADFADSGQDTYRFPDIEATLETASGYCNEKTTLAAIMLKSLAIPVKIFHGDILLEDTSGDETTRAYHAWLHVYLDDSWVLYDPSAFDGEVPSITDNGFGKYLQDTALVR